MKKILLFILFLSGQNILAQSVEENYPTDPASEQQAGIPKGEVLKFTFENSKIFPGTWREYWVYVPAQYKADKPACVYVNQDGIQWKAPTVFDNLIHKGEMPVTIGVFVMHGKVRAIDPDAALDRFNRSFEFDGLGENYAHFILDEILPEVEKQKTSDGRAIKLSKNGNDRAIGGSSSGAVCAFTAAWERPDAFSRVFSAIGTYVGLRGADRYPTLIRKYEPKPLRIYLQDGSNDLNIYAGDWWMANQTMLRALNFAGYEVNHKWGAGGHNGKQGTAIFPEAMRYLWKDWPAEVKLGVSQNQVLSAVLVEGQGWDEVGAGLKFTDGLTSNNSGEVFFQGVLGKSYKSIPDGKLETVEIQTKNTSAIKFDKKGNRYEANKKTRSIIKYNSGKKQSIATNIVADDLTIAFNGNMYVSVSEGKENSSTIYLIRQDGEKMLADKGLRLAKGLALSPDQSLLYVTESTSHWVWVYQILADGTLAYKQKYGYLHVPDTEENAGARAITCDREGRIYVATNSGVQVMDQTGRVNAILPTPNGYVSNLVFGGKEFDYLFVTANGKVYRRKLNTHGANNWDKPNKPAAPKL
ncbi:SMP-30/gluconolactonase/LRE family protein [Dyadobacter psychrotolerans]|uniref:Gluconolactonase n=1 Tax=Dyadobacter psychrotolerans TaxID=2541721 RepID=A0A4R5DQX1_9BACT|nr:SMP-30/gluconolactonase/LRE family protein [Dyadobacter psychrotolerans]TDE14600.1 gluconolactonase [Dyadobacter psychrotolerans]